MGAVMATTGDNGDLLPGGICVLGLGLIGGSLVRALDSRTTTFGWSPSEGTRTAAAADGVDVLGDLDAALERADATGALTVLAGPVTSFPSVLRRIDAVAPTLALTDVASVKAPVETQVAELAPQARFVGSHPMAGTAQSGWAAGSADLFTDAAWVTTLTEDTDPADWAAVAAMALATGARVVPAEALAHDEAVARVSHLPHLLALVLAQVGAAGGTLALSLAASSFRDGTRVAGTRPELIRAMCETNRDSLLDAVDDALGILGVARGSLASTGSLAKLAEAGHAGRMRYDAGPGTLVPVTLQGADLIEQLLSIGAAGGHVTGVGAGAGGPVVRAHFPTDG
nr:prephenate dehydrogenase [Nakamurella flavida]